MDCRDLDTPAPCRSQVRSGRGGARRSVHSHTSRKHIDCLGRSGSTSSCSRGNLQTRCATAHVTKQVYRRSSAPTPAVYDEPAAACVDSNYESKSSAIIIWPGLRPVRHQKAVFILTIYKFGHGKDYHSTYARPDSHSRYRCSHEAKLVSKRKSSTFLD